MNIKRYLTKRKKLIDEKMLQFLPKKEDKPKKLSEAIHYCMLDGGKRIRAIIMLEVAELVDKSIEDIIKSACGIEMIHTSTLLLDDLPSMDDALLRRGKPALHRIHGEATTILCAYILLVNGIQLIIENAFDKNISLEKIHDICNILLLGLGKDGVMGGQQMDLDLSNKKLNTKIIEEIHGKKTVSLFVISMKIASTILEVDESLSKNLDKFAKYFGSAFQIKDDLLSVKEKPKISGKLSLTREIRPNYAILMGVKKAESRLKFYTEHAVKSLKSLKNKAEPLIEITKYLKERKY